MGWDTKRKWPQEARIFYRVYATPQQVAEWQEAMAGSAHKSLDTWLAVAGSFFAWWTKRERELFDQASATLDEEAREKARELEAEAPCPEP